MYLVRELNRNKLFQRTSKFILDDDCKNILPQIFYRASACLLSFKRISQYQQRCAMELYLFEDQIDIVDNRILFVSEESISILNEITNLLSALRIMQNQFIRLLRAYYKIQLPKSMNDYIKKQSSFDLPEEVKMNICQYWEDSGKYLKNLRDIDQHYYFLVENSFMTILPEKGLHIIFPDNPEDKSPKLFKFDRNIDGLRFLSNSFNKIHSLFENFGKWLGYEEGDVIFYAGLGHLLKGKVEEKRTLMILYQEYLENIGIKVRLNVKATIFSLFPNGEPRVVDIPLSKKKNEEYNRFFTGNSHLKYN